MSDEIGQALGLLGEQENIVEIQDKFVELPPSPIKRRSNTERPTISTVIDDFNYSRDVIHYSLEKAASLLEIALTVVQETQSPRAVEVASGLVKQVSLNAKDLLMLSKIANDLTKSELDDEQDEGNKLTTYELNALLEEADNE